VFEGFSIKIRRMELGGMDRVWKGFNLRR
jgi:hypothetical protein